MTRELDADFEAAEAALERDEATRECVHCGETIHRVVEDHWTGWEDDEGDQLSYSPHLHDHEPGATL